MADIEPEGRVAVRGPQRAGSRRNFEALLAAAREVFAADGVNGSLEAIARRAGVGIGTLYRHFPTRQTLFEAVYVDEVEALARVEDLDDHDPWDALETWLRRFVGWATTKKAIQRRSTSTRRCSPPRASTASTAPAARCSNEPRGRARREPTSTSRTCAT